MPAIPNSPATRQEKTVDDRDPAIVYSKPPLYDWNTRSYGGFWEYMGTTSLTTRKGATATFSFDGTSVSVYGTVTVNASLYPTSSYTIDGGEPVFYTPQRPEDRSREMYRTPFFRSPELSAGRHTLVIRNEVDGGLYWLDYLTYTPGPPTVGMVTRTIVGAIFGALANTSLIFIGFILGLMVAACIKRKSRPLKKRPAAPATSPSTDIALEEQAALYASWESYSVDPPSANSPVARAHHVPAEAVPPRYQPASTLDSLV
ncbi:unnamed protein product [Cyclocybe aegerita]|uniref:Uncharacterized protein n=1 Tax=Cyclocybe aegerita TaxID=1973307 RepID=A0A8S0XQ78_CYCAE|nr:unnamed protein product [Cyclocybe aegerita]